MQHDKSQPLATQSIGKLLLKLSIPAVAAQLVNMLYNMVDRMYIGRIPLEGTLALTGMGVCMPVILLISASAALVSMGGAPRASIKMGQQSMDEAEQILGNCTGALLGIAAMLTVVFLAFAEPLLLLFGASGDTIGYALDYMRIYVAGTVFVQLALGLNAFITAQGFATTSMLTVLIGAICNIVLDPIFIFGFGMGVRGAALATVISQAVSAVWVVAFLRGKKTTLRLQIKNLKPVPAVLLPCLALGLSPFIMQSTESILMIAFNTSLQKYGGDIAVGAMTIFSTVMQFTMLPIVGFSQGAQPITSYNYGARNVSRVKAAFMALLKVSASFSVCLWLAVQLFPQGFARIFTTDTTLIEYASKYLRIYMGCSCLMGVQLACQQTFIAIGNAKASLFLALLRKIILLIPLIYLLPMLMADKVTAVFLAEPVADLIAVITTATLFAVQFRKALRALNPKQLSQL